MIRSLTTHLKWKDSVWHLRIKAKSSERNKTFREHFSIKLKVNNNEIIDGKYVDINIGEDGTGQAEISETISENYVSLWWPNGYGEQPLYDLDVYLTSRGNIIDIFSHKHLKFGFRTIEVVEEDASIKLGNTTALTRGLTFYFKINGYPVFMKGSNWILANILPEHGDDAYHVNNILTSARNAHMNMLRVWGRGVYESDYFYRRCDELDILIWQDLMFASAMYPTDAEFLSSVRNDVEQNVIQLQHHPCIAIWVGNNENEAALWRDWFKTKPEIDRYKKEYMTLYVDTIKPNDVDPQRRYIVSSPSNGVIFEQEGFLSRNPYDFHYGDTHNYNYSVNHWDPNIFPPTRFASEYGIPSMPCLLTIRTATNEAKDFHLDNHSRRWKMVHYFAKSFFSPVLVSPRLTPSGDVDVYIINDRFVPIVGGQITLDIFNYSSLVPIRSQYYSAEAGPLCSQKQNIYLSFRNALEKDETFFRFSLKMSGVNRSPYNYVFPISLKSVTELREPHIQISVSPQIDRDNGLINIYTINISVDTLVLFLWLEVNSTDGHFENNGFIVTEPNVKVKFVSKKIMCPHKLLQSVTFKYYIH